MAEVAPGSARAVGIAQGLLGLCVTVLTAWLAELWRVSLIDAQHRDPHFEGNGAIITKIYVLFALVATYGVLFSAAGVYLARTRRSHRLLKPVTVTFGLAIAAVMIAIIH